MASDTMLQPSASRLLTALDRTNSALTTDFCPWANRYVYWLKNPLSVLMLAIVGSALCALLVNPLVFLLTGILILVIGAGVVLPSAGVRGIDCTVIFDVRRTSVGKPALVRLRITNRWPIPVWGLSLIRGFADMASPDGDEGVALARVPGWSTVEYSWPFTPRRRGLYPRETAEVETGFPFGLFHARKAAQVDGHLIVWPETARLDGIPDSSESSQSEDRYCDRRAGDGGDMTGTRPFRAGDSLRRVHWAQTARQQTLIVTERQSPARSTIRIVVDLFHDSHPAETAGATLEDCVQAAASLCESLHRQKCRVELVIGDKVLVADEGASGFQRVMDALAVAELTVAPPPHPTRRTRSEIRVTTSHGFRPDHPSQIVVAADEECPGAWIALPGDSSVTDQLPRLWRRMCHVA